MYVVQILLTVVFSSSPICDKTTGNVTFICTKDEHPLNASFPILLTNGGISISFSELQFMKAYFFMHVIDCGNDIFCKDLQFSKVNLFIPFIDERITTFFNRMQSLKTLIPIYVIDKGNSTSSKEVQFIKAALSISFTD